MNLRNKVTRYLWPLVVIATFQIAFSQTNYWIKTNAAVAANINILGMAINSLGYIFVSTSGSGVFRSTDYGGSWTSVSNTSGGQIAINSHDHIFVCGSDYVYRSTDNGETWIQCAAGSSVPQEPLNIAISSTDRILVGAQGQFGYGLYTSIDDGDSWTLIKQGGAPEVAVNPSGYIFAGLDSGVYRSTNNGMTWMQVSLGLPVGTYGMTMVLRIAISSSGVIFCGVLYFEGPAPNPQYNWGVFRSTNNGNSWVSVGLTNAYLADLAISSSGEVFAAFSGSGVYHSTDGGDTWSQINSGLTDLDTHVFAWNPDGFLFLACGIASGDVFRTMSSVSSANVAKGSIPNSIELMPNYPNPFNPSTNIEFSLPGTSETKLVVYDELGREIIGLVDQLIEPGTFKVMWSGINSKGELVPSGIYFYRLQATSTSDPTKSFTQVKKMLLLK